MANLKIREADTTISEVRGSGTGTALDPKIPHHALIDPANGAVARMEVDNAGRPVLPVHDEHVHEFSFNTHLAKPTDTPFVTTLTSAAPANSYQLELASVTGLAVGNKIQLSTTEYREFDYIRVQAINGLVVDIDRRIDRDYPIGSTVERFTLDLNVSGSLAAPVSFKYFPRPGKIQHLETMLVYIRSTAEPYDSSFGGIATLANGLHIRKFTGATGEFQGEDVVRVNQRFIQSGWNVRYGDRSSPADAYSTTAFLNTLNLTSSMYRLIADDGDYFEVLVQDNLTTLAGFEFKVSGHEEL